MIDYNETRGISKETLNELLQELNPDFIKKLPDTPQEILKFAKRRVNPYISENINETLAKQMLETRQTDKEYLLTLFKAMTITFINGQDPSQHPVAAVLVSQTGAGKTSLRELINPQKEFQWIATLCPSPHASLLFGMWAQKSTSSICRTVF